MTTVICGRRAQAATVAHQRCPRHVQVAVRRGGTGREAVVAEGRVGKRDDLLQVCYLYRLAESHTAVRGLYDIGCIERREPSCTIKDHVDGSVRCNNGA